ncbi:MAG TPA: hypothetical protein VI248_05175 [Kineosporiaceae bacterium]
MAVGTKSWLAVGGPLEPPDGAGRDGIGRRIVADDDCWAGDPWLPPVAGAPLTVPGRDAAVRTVAAPSVGAAPEDPGCGAVGRGRVPSGPTGGAPDGAGAPGDAPPDTFDTSL